jgi:hypothetical protein
MSTKHAHSAAILLISGFAIGMPSLAEPPTRPGRPIASDATTSEPIRTPSGNTPSRPSRPVATPTPTVPAQPRPSPEPMASPPPAVVAPTIKKMVSGRAGRWEDQQTWMSDLEVQSLGGGKRDDGWPGPINQPLSPASPEGQDVLILHRVTLDTDAEVNSLRMLDTPAMSGKLVGNGTLQVTDLFTGGSIDQLTLVVGQLGGSANVQLENGATIKASNGLFELANPLHSMVTASSLASVPSLLTKEATPLNHSPVVVMRSRDPQREGIPVSAIGGFGTVDATVKANYAPICAGSGWLYIDTLPKLDAQRPFLSVLGDVSLTHSDLHVFTERFHDEYESMPACWVSGRLSFNDSTLVMHEDPKASPESPGTVRLLVTAKEIDGNPNQLGFLGPTNAETGFSSVWWALDVDRSKLGYFNTAAGLSGVRNGFDCITDILTVVGVPWRLKAALSVGAGVDALKNLATADGAASNPAERSSLNHTIDAICLKMPQTNTGLPLRVAVLRARKLIVVTHGTNSSISNSRDRKGSESMSGVAAGLARIIEGCELQDEWQVVTLDWSEFATGGARCHRLLQRARRRRLSVMRCSCVTRLKPNTPTAKSGCFLWGKDEGVCASTGRRAHRRTTSQRNVQPTW